MNDALHDLTLGGILDAHATSRPRALAVVCGGRRLDFATLRARVDRLASELRETGVGRGDRILWLGQNCHRLLEGLLAAGRLGAVFCPANWRQSVSEFEFVIEDNDPAVVFWQEAEIGDVVQAARSQQPSRAKWIQHDGSGNQSYEGRLSAPRFEDDKSELSNEKESSTNHPDSISTPSEEASFAGAEEADAVLMMYTAAFSGTSNGALLSHKALLLQGAFVGMLMGISPDYVYLNSGPLFHVATFMSTLATFVYGGTNVFTPRVDAEELCRLISEERCTGAFILGPTVDQIVELNPDGRYDLKSLKGFGGKPDWSKMITIDESPWGRHPGGYGQTEVMGLATFSALGPSIGTHGRPAPLVRIAVLDPEGNELPPGETGEIAVRGPTVMNGYFRRPEINSERQAAGWHHTNDLGRIEEDGSLSFVGPKTRLIKSAAENIYPTEVEAAIRSHPSVADVAVIGVPDPKWGQNVKAVVVVREGQSLGADEIVEHCRKVLSSYKKPKSIEFVDALPRNGFTVDYAELDQRFGGGGYPGTAP